MGYYSEQHALLEEEGGHGMSECEWQHAMEEQLVKAGHVEKKLKGSGDKKCH